MNEKFPLALPVNTVLAGKYVIEKVLGQGGFGITYKAKNYETGEPVAIKEYFPDSLAARTGTTVNSFSGERKENFEYGKSCFLEEAETLAQFSDVKGVVNVHSFFEENDTAYFVMEFIEGTSFDVLLKENGGKVPYAKARDILVPVMEALAQVHAEGIVHRDVTPDNIYITKSGDIKLLDFGAARYSLGDKSKSLDVILKHGYAPKEQYSRRGKQGPYTDVYSVGACFNVALTGKRPPDSIDRMDEDELKPLSELGVEIGQAQENAILKALAIQPADRFQSMGEFRDALLKDDPMATSEVQNQVLPEGLGKTDVKEIILVKKEKTQPQQETEPVNVEKKKYGLLNASIGLSSPALTYGMFFVIYLLGDVVMRRSSVYALEFIAPILAVVFIPLLIIGFNMRAKGRKFAFLLNAGFAAASIMLSIILIGTAGYHSTYLVVACLIAAIVCLIMHIVRGRKKNV
ncbi:MAG: serine/threonine protein kinase [Lachnospiraceae bacterium]|nr:serine/threonine protein kinase [Lachnospiraceae bacterium]